MSVLVKVPVADTMIAELEKNAIEIDIYTGDINFLLAENKENAEIMEAPLFKALHEQLTAAKLNFEVKKAEAANTYVPEILRDKHQYEWNIDFRKAEMTITVMCGCGVEALREAGIAYEEIADEVTE